MSAIDPDKISLPKIRVTNPGTLLVYPDGQVATYEKIYKTTPDTGEGKDVQGEKTDLVQKRPICAIDANAGDKDSLAIALASGDYRRAFTNVESFENRLRFNEMQGNDNMFGGGRAEADAPSAQRAKNSLLSGAAAPLTIPGLRASTQPTPTTGGLPGLGGDSAPASIKLPAIKDAKTKLEIFKETFSANEDEYAAYKAANSNEDKRTVLERIYDRHVEALLANSAIGVKITELQQARYGGKTGAIAKREDEALIPRVRSELEKMNPDLLEVGAAAGLRVFASRAKDTWMFKFNKSTAFLNPALLDIVVTDDVFKHNLPNLPGVSHASNVLNEELVHFADFQLGTTQNKAWVDAVKKDLKTGDPTVNMGDLKNPASSLLSYYSQLTKKTPLFRQDEHAMYVELLPELSNIDRFYDAIMKAAKQVYEKGQPEAIGVSRNTPERIKQEHLKKVTAYAYAKSIVPVCFNKDDNGALIPRPKDEVMTQIMPNVWPLYQKFKQQVTDKAAQLREERQQAGEGHDTWAAEILARRKPGETEVGG